MWTIGDDHDAEAPFAVVVRPDSPIKTFPELIAAAKAAPGKVSYGLSGIGSVPHLLFYTVAARAAAEFNAVAYKNYSLVVPDTMAGRLDFAVMSFGSFQSPPLRILAVLREQRHPHFPDAPSSTELGFLRRENELLELRVCPEEDCDPNDGTALQYEPGVHHRLSLRLDGANLVGETAGVDGPWTPLAVTPAFEHTAARLHFGVEDGSNPTADHVEIDDVRLCPLE